MFCLLFGFFVGFFVGFVCLVGWFLLGFFYSSFYVNLGKCFLYCLIYDIFLRHLCEIYLKLTKGSIRLFGVISDHTIPGTIMNLVLLALSGNTIQYLLKHIVLIK